MNRWQGLVAILKLFEPSKRPVAALFALAIIIGIPAAATVLLASYAKTALATKVERR